MAQTRKDLRGRVLRKGESQRRSDERYVYTYTDPLGRRKYVYAQDLVTLREKEAQLLKDQMDGLDIYVAGKATVNFVFDRYMSLKNNLKPTTKSNYLYMYDRFVRDTFGKRNIAEIKYSDVVQFYNYLVEKQELQINTLETVHTLLHPTFQLAVRDDIIRKNPSDGVMAELKKNGFITLKSVSDDVKLAEEDLLITMTQMEGYVTEGDNTVTVVLDTNLTPELIEEGFVREIISKIQTMRKEAGFEVMDKIMISYQADDKVAAIFDKYGDAIKADVLGLDVVAGSVDGYEKEWNINGETVLLGVKKGE